MQSKPIGKDAAWTAALVAGGTVAVVGIAAAVHAFWKRKPSVLTFYGADFCPFNQRAWLTLLEKGAPHDLIEVSLVNKPQFFLDASPNGTVPAGMYEGRPVYESIPLCRFIDEEFDGPPLMPHTPMERLRANILISKFDSGITGPLYAALMKQDPTEQKENMDKLLAVLKEMDKELARCESKGPYFFGDQFTLADIIVLPFIERALVVLNHYRNFVIPTTPDLLRVHRWIDACFSRPSFRITSADRSDDSLRTHPYSSTQRKPYLLEVYKSYSENRVAEAKEALRLVRPPLAR